MLWSRSRGLDREPGVGYEPNHFVPLLPKQQEKSGNLNQSKLNFQILTALSDDNKNNDTKTVPIQNTAKEVQFRKNNDVNVASTKPDNETSTGNIDDLDAEQNRKVTLMI